MAFAWPFKSSPKADTALAFTLGENSMRYVHATEANERGATLAAWGTEDRGHMPREAFLKRVKAALPKAERVIAVLEPEEYRILQMEAPNVPRPELRGAIRWRAAEFVEGSPHDYTFDVLPGAGEGAKVTVVVAHNNIVRARMVEAEGMDQPLSVIDVGETAQRNLLHAALLAEPGAPEVAASLVADSGRALVVIGVRGQLSFFRRFEFNIDMLAGHAGEGESGLMGQSAEAETISRSLGQLHRSLDLWDDSYPHLPLATLRVHAGTKTDAIVERLVPEAGVDTKPLALGAIFRTPAARKGSPWLDTSYLPLLGALLRPVTVD
jgi:MSHA biogenesis protein MshI